MGIMNIGKRDENNHHRPKNELDRETMETLEKKSALYDG